jgi:hypothetical protein
MSESISVNPPASPAAQEPHAGSLPKRVVDTFFSPVALFGRFGARPPWLDVMILSVALGVLSFVLIPREVWTATMEEAMRQRGQEVPANMDPEQMAGMQRTLGLIFGGVVVPWIFLVVQAGAMVLLFSVILGGGATFRQYLSVAAHASLISAMGALAALPVILQKGVMQGITLGALAGGMDPDGFVYRFLNAWNVFLVWQFVVLGLGAAALNRRIGAGTAVGALLGLYAVVAVIIAVV